MMMRLMRTRTRSELPRVDDVVDERNVTPQLLKIGRQDVVRVHDASFPPLKRLGGAMVVGPPHAPCVVDVNKCQLIGHEQLTVRADGVLSVWSCQHALVAWPKAKLGVLAQC